MFTKRNGLILSLSALALAACNSSSLTPTSQSANSSTPAVSTCSTTPLLGVCNSDNVTSVSSNTLTLGALIPITGASASEGVEQQAILGACINQILKGPMSGSGLTIKVLVGDGKSNPTTSANLAQAFINGTYSVASDGTTVSTPSACVSSTSGSYAASSACVKSQTPVNLFVGPDTSDSSAAVLSIANSYGGIVVSPSSTAPTLAIANDNLLRTVPSDVHQGYAIANVLKTAGIDCVVNFARNDIYGSDLNTAINTAVVANGGQTLQILYDTTTLDYTSYMQTALLPDVQNMIKNCGGGSASKVAVQVSAYDEAALILDAASKVDAADTNHTLSSVTWIGSDGFTQDPVVTADPVASAFAIKVNLQSPIFTVATSNLANYNAFVSAIAAATTPSVSPATYSVTFCDSILLLAKAAVAAGTGSVNVQTMRNQIVTAAASTTGFSGPLTMDCFGDRATGNYNFYVIGASGSSYVWNLGANTQISGGPAAVCPSSSTSSVGSNPS